MRIVIKIGTSTLTYENGCVNIRRIEALCKVVADLMNAGNEVILVSSGAIGMGMGKLHLKSRPEDIAMKQACAAVGQCELMHTYEKIFAEYNYTVAQILLTAPDLECPDRHGKFIDTVQALLSMNVLPVINENDTVATAEIVFGDNDTLAAEVAVSLQAALLVLLSDIDGLYTADPHLDPDARLIREVYRLDEKVLALGGGAGTQLGTGGMVTKLRAAGICLAGGTDMLITNGAAPERLYALLDGQQVGTRFYAKERK